jgi:hypothetical protein
MDWKKELNEAHLYAKVAKGLVKNQRVDNETLYHIICLSVEKYLATLAGMVNYIPMHSGLSFVIRELAKKMELPSQFIDDVRFLNSFMTYCSLDFEQPKLILETDIERMVRFLDEIGEFTGEKSLQ